MKRSSSINCILLVLFLGLWGVVPGVAQTWHTVRQEDTKIRMLGWPKALACSYRDGGYRSNFATKRTAVFCPSVPFHGGERTYVRFEELQPGYYWQGGFDIDIRERPIFNKKDGYFGYFRGANFVSGQEFRCYSSTKCGFRVIRFSVNEMPCQWVFFNPDIGTTDGFTGASEAPYAIELVHCGRALPFQRSHFGATPGAVKIRFPGFLDPKVNDGDRDTRRATSICRMALNGDQSDWQMAGFRSYVEIARGEGLTIPECRKLLIAEAERTKKKLNSQPVPETENQNRFANCFDDPAKCQ